MADRQTSLAAAISITAGLAVAWMDSRPGYDDTAITAVSLALAAAAATVIAGRRPWLWAIATGIWVPLAELRDLANSGPLLALAFAAVGAAAGRAITALSRDAG